MTASQIAQIILRIFALSWLLQALGQVVGGFFITSGGFPWIVLAPALVIAALAVAVWRLAPRIAKNMCAGNDEATLVSGINFRQMLTAMFVGLGVYFCLSSFGAVFNWIYLLALEQADPKAIPQGLRGTEHALARDILTFGAGLFVIFTSRNWASKLAK